MKNIMHLSELYIFPKISIDTWLFEMAHMVCAKGPDFY